MIVEFVGSTGAGKTTLASAVRLRLNAATDVTTSFELLAAPLGLQGLRHPTLRNLVQEFVGLPFLARSIRRHRAFVRFALGLIARQKGPRLHALNYVRSLERTLGVHEALRRRRLNRVVLVDEGTLLAAHNVFVFTAAPCASTDIVTYGTLVPLPDVVVHVRAPLDSLIARAIARSDPPRELKSRNRVLIATYTARAAALFEQLLRVDTIRDRVITVDNEDGKVDALADRVAEGILARHRRYAHA
jgi:thymidylate kinase